MKNLILKQKNLLLLTFFIIIFVFVFLLSSCEGIVNAEGIIYDSSTEEPICDVKCQILPEGIIKFSDSLGKYYVTTGMTNCVPKCPDIDVKFSKTGYKTKIVTNPKKSDIFLDKEQNNPVRSSD